MPQSQWETLVKEKINIRNILIVLVGKTMASASGVSKEILIRWKAPRAVFRARLVRMYQA
jgi:hypothetical protein